MEKLDDGDAAPSPDIDAKVDVGMHGAASGFLASNEAFSSVPQETEAQELIPHPDHSKDVSADPPVPADSKHPQLFKLALATKHLVEEQQTVSAKRSQVRELRQALKHKREEESNLRTALMKKLNALFAQQDPSMAEPLVRDYEALQLITEAYLDLENNYHDAEDQLEQEEYRLGKSMERFAGSSFDSPFRDPSDPTQFTLDDYPHDDDDVSSSVASVTQDLPQGVVEYLSRVGDVRLLQEHLLDLDSQWLTITDKQKQRSPLHLPLDDESLEFLRMYDEERRKTWCNLNHAQLDVNQLRSICEENGLLKDEHTMDLDILCPLGLGDATRQIDDPLKLSVDDGSSYFFEPQTTTQLNSTRFINKWILHQLRNSSIEIRRLKSRPELQPLRDRGFNDASISRWALREWFSDDVGLSPPPPSTLPPDEDHIATTDSVRAPKNKSNPILSKSHSEPLLCRTSHSIPFRSPS